MHQDKERWYRDSIFSSSDDQRTLSNQEGCFYIAPPSCGPSFALLLLILLGWLWCRSPRDQNKTKQNKQDLGQTKNICLETQEIEVYQESYMKEKVSRYPTTSQLLPLPFSLSVSTPFYHATFLFRGNLLALGQVNLALYPSSLMKSWAIYLTFSSFIFLICKMASQSC